MMEMTLSEARQLVKSPIWPAVRDIFVETGELRIYPRGDMRRLEYLDEDTRRQIELWQEAIGKIGQWRKIVSRDEVRKLKEDYPGIYPEIFRYALYFEGKGDRLELLLKLKFPEAYDLCFC